MSHEKVSLYLGGLNAQSPYFPYIRERNGSIARHIARYLGIAYDPVARLTPPEGTDYIVPGKTIDTAQAALLQIESGADFYGGMAPDFGMVGKTILHPSVSEMNPDFYSPAFAETVSSEKLALPGITGFSAADLLDGYRRLEPQYACRLKAANESDGNGQHIIADGAALTGIIARLDGALDEGAVIEPNLENHHTVSAGIFHIGHDPYSFAASQQNDRAGGRDRYRGAREVTVIRGGLLELADLLRQADDPRFMAVAKSARFHALFLAHYPVLASRLSYDVLSGTAGGREMTGITDITARLGGTCPALILGARYLQEHSHIQATVGQVNLNYDPGNVMGEERDAETFLDAPSLRITAKIDRVL